MYLQRDINKSKAVFYHSNGFIKKYSNNNFKKCTNIACNSQMYVIRNTSDMYGYLQISSKTPTKNLATCLKGDVNREN